MNKIRFAAMKKDVDKAIEMYYEQEEKKQKFPAGSMRNWGECYSGVDSWESYVHYIGQCAKDVLDEYGPNACGYTCAYKDLQESFEWLKDLYEDACDVYWEGVNELIAKVGERDKAIEMCYEDYDEEDEYWEDLNAYDIKTVDDVFENYPYMTSCTEVGDNYEQMREALYRLFDYAE